jgi:acetyl/propionyl-CoA carboxylase alpha subunit
VITGIDTNVAFLERLLATPEVEAGAYDTGFVERRAPELVSATSTVDDPLLAAAAAVVASLAGAGAHTAEAESTLSPWVTLERAERLGR